MKRKIPKGTHLEEAEGSLDMTYQSFYIGLYSPSRQINDWAFTDGTSFDFTNWLEGRNLTMYQNCKVPGENLKVEDILEINQVIMRYF